MKKVVLLTLLLIASVVIVSCTATKSESAAEVSEPVVIEAPVEVAPVETEAETAIVSEPVEQPAEVVEVEAPAEPVVIDSAPAISSEDPQIEEKFSYVYGHLLASGIKDQDISLVPRYFVAGSSDFFNYVDPALSEQQINDLFVSYQSFIDGQLTEEDLDTMEVEPAGEMTTFYDQFSYGYGYVVQYNLQSQGILVKIDSFHNGVSDAFNDVPLNYTDEEIDELFMAYQQKLMADYNTMVEELAAQNLADAEAFLEENATAEGVMTTDSGLQYKVISEGDEAYPTATDTVELDYMITYLDGSTGDSSYSRGTPSVFSLENLIPGFKEGVMMMPVGSHYRFYVHPDLAYTEIGTESIPPNTLLIFDVELRDIVAEETE